MGAFNDFENKTKQQKVIKDLRNKRTVEYAPGGKTYMVKMYKVDSFGRKVAAALAGSKARHEFERSLDLEPRGIPAARRRRLCFDYGKFARRLHDAGVWQYDFNPSNVLVRDREMLLIDFERVKMRPRALPAEERYYLLAKMNRLTDLSRTDRRRFLKGYLAAHVLESRQPKLAATEILRRGARHARSEER